MPVSDYALCTLQEVKEYLDLNTSAEEDKLLESFIDRVTDIFEKWTDRQFKSREYTEYLDGSDGSDLFPKHYPIISITSIHDDADWSWGSSTEVSSSDYRISNSARYIASQTTFSKEDQNIKIVYTAGYAEIPADLKEASIEEVTRRFKRRKTLGIESKAIGEGSDVYSVGMPEEVISVLTRYRRIIARC